MSARCPQHPGVELVVEPGQSAPVTCQVCGVRYCLDCGKRAPEAWSSGACHGCYRKRMEAQKQREHDEYMESLARAWDEGFKQGGPMHDVNYDDPDAHKRNPYRRVVTP